MHTHSLEGDGQDSPSIKKTTSIVHTHLSVVVCSGVFVELRKESSTAATYTHCACVILSVILVCNKNWKHLKTKHDKQFK